MSGALKIGGVTLAPRTVIAPMAGYTDYAMRTLCARAGVGLTVTEMVSAKGLVYNGEKCAQLLVTAPEEKVKAVQLFGHEPEFFRDALQTDYLKKFDIIDINMGCPVPKIVKNGEGSALLKTPELAQKIVETCVLFGGGRPVTVKTRVGFDAGENVAEDFALRMQDAGASALTLHGRTRAMGYSGVSDWSVISSVADKLDIPVIGSGDVDEHNVSERLSRCSAVMIGRAAIGDPWIFARAVGSPVPMSKRQTLNEHIHLMQEAYGEHYTVVNMRKHIGYYLKGVQGNKELKMRFYAANTVAELLQAVSDVLDDRF